MTIEGLGYGRQRLIEEIVKKNFGIEPYLKNFSYKELLFVVQEMLTDEGRQYLEGGSSDKFGYIRFRRFVKHLLYRNIANYDSMILCTGEKGSSKSSVAMMIAKYWCHLLGFKFDPKRHIAYNNADVMRLIKELKPFEPLIADESLRFITAENWAKKENKNLKILLGQIRTKHLLFIMAFPLKLEKVDKVYLESYITYWCLTGDTKILIKDNRNNGMIRNYPLSKLKFKDYEIATYNQKTNKIEFKKLNKNRVLTNKNAEIYEIELENGVKIKSTKEHQFLTKEGYKKLSDLTDKDELFVRTKSCLNCKEEFVPKKEQMRFCCKKCNSSY